MRPIRSLFSVRVFSTDPRQLAEVAQLGGPYGITYDPTRDRLWVSSSGTNEVIGYDMAEPTPREVSRVPTVQNPYTVGVDAQTGRLFIAGVTDGVACDVIRQGTAGDKPAPDIFDDLNVEAYQCRERGMAAIAAERGETPVDAILSVAREDHCVEGVVHIRSEDDVRYFIGHPLAMIGSDGTAMSPTGPWQRAAPHPRTYGCYPRLLGRYVREYGVLGLEEAVHKMTGVVADRLHMSGIGRIAEGKAADIVVFDADTVIDTATWEDPHQYPVGIPHVIVGGEPVIRDGAHTGARPGRVLRRGGV